MKTPFLSIITVSLNNLVGLQKTMESVFSQDFRDFEYILIDGASTDGSLQLIKSNKERLGHWVTEPDTGIYNAMNKGITASKGEYLLFLNSGDVLINKFALSEFIQHPQFKGDIIYGDYKFDDGEKVYPDILYPAYFIKTSLPHQSTFFKKEVFNLMGMYNENYKISADRAFYISCYLNEGIKFQHIPYFLTLFDRSGISNDLKFLEKKKEEDDLIFRNLFGVNYQKYKDEITLERINNRAKRNNLSHFINRIKNWFYTL